MELLIGAVISLAIQGYKKLGDRFGFTVTNSLLYIVLFLSAGVYTYLTQTGALDAGALGRMLQVVSASIGTYELLIKRVTPLIQK